MQRGVAERGEAQGRGYSVSCVLLYARGDFLTSQLCSRYLQSLQHHVIEGAVPEDQQYVVVQRVNGRASELERPLPVQGD